MLGLNLIYIKIRQYFTKPNKMKKKKKKKKKCNTLQTVAL